jgi:Flp pilus assembly protein protease CpaA
MPFLLVTTLTGGALCLITLWFQRWGLMVQAYLASLGVAMPSGGTPRLPEGSADPSGASTTLPYGVAIAAGGTAVIIELLKL